jgi:hypothetical protein
MRTRIAPRRFANRVRAADVRGGPALERTMFLFMLYSCDPKVETASPPAVDCVAMCSEMEATALSVLASAGAPSTSEAWQAHCADGGEQTCDACYQYIQLAFVSAAVALNCGCGLTTAGVAECTQDIDVTDEEASSVIASCTDTCAAYPAS